MAADRPNAIMSVFQQRRRRRVASNLSASSSSLFAAAVVVSDDSVARLCLLAVFVLHVSVHVEDGLETLAAEEADPAYAVF